MSNYLSPVMKSTKFIPLFIFLAFLTRSPDVLGDVTNGNQFEQRFLIDGALSRIFDVVLHVGACNTNPTSASSQLCLWRSLIAGKLMEPEIIDEIRWVNSTSGASITTSSFSHPIVLLQHRAIWSCEALAYAAHLSALRVCTAIGQQNCVIVTENLEWLGRASMGQVSIEEALGRQSTSHIDNVLNLMKRFNGNHSASGSLRTYTWSSANQWKRINDLNGYMTFMSEGLSQADLFPDDASWDLAALPSGCTGWAHLENASVAVPGCVLVFNKHSISKFQRLTSPSSSSSAALLPILIPFYSKVAALARQEQIKLVVYPPSSVLNASLRKRRYLVFTSSGDQGVWRMWAGPHRTYDLVVGYYGRKQIESDGFRSAGTRVYYPNGTSGVVLRDRNWEPDFVYRVHGSKHQNMHRLHALYPGLLASYDAIAVWDDDLVISTDEINSMFRRFSELAGMPGDVKGIWVAQPSLGKGSRVDHAILGHATSLLLSYVSFIEVNACVFRSDKLMAVLDSLTYTGELVGYGVDYAIIASLGQLMKDRYAVMHEFQVLNPWPSSKPEGREILKLASQMARVAQWETYQRRFNIRPLEPHAVYKCLPRDEGLGSDEYPSYCPEHRNTSLTHDEDSV